MLSFIKMIFEKSHEDHMRNWKQMDEIEIAIDKAVKAGKAESDINSLRTKWLSMWMDHSEC
jgi:chromosome condensin MukBEF complex kleisin-like MukF subunit